MDTVDRGPWHKMLDKQALALQAQIGGSYESAFTKVYEDPSNRTIVEQDHYEHIARSHDLMFGSGLSSIPVAKAAPSYDPLRKAAEIAESYGPAHAKMHSLAVDHMRAHPGQSYASAYAYLYTQPQNAGLREKVKSEHMSSTMSAHGSGDLDKAALPPDPLDPIGSAHDEMDDLIAAYRATHPKATREMAFTAIYVDAANAPLKARFDAEEAAFSYSSPGHSSPLQHAPNIGYSGRKPKGWAGG